MIGCCCEGEINTSEEAIATKRKCRDVLGFIFFLAFCGGMVYVCCAAFSMGDPRRLYHGIDSYGNVCGANNNWDDRESGPDLTHSKRLYFLDPFELQNPLQYQYAKAICVSECPPPGETCGIDSLPCLNAEQYRCPYYALAESSVAGSLTGVADPWSVDYYSQLASSNASCTEFTDSIIPPDFRDEFELAPPYPSGATQCGLYFRARSQLPGRGPCYPVWAESAEFMHRCLPKLPPQLAQQFGSLGSLAGASLNNSRDRLQRYINDIGRGIALILAAGLGVGLVLSVFWVVFLRFFAGVMAWLTVLAANLLFAGATVLCYQKAGMLTTWGSVGAYLSEELAGLSQELGEDPAEADRQQWAYLAYAVSGLTGLLLLFSLVMAQRIKVAVATLKVASQAVAHVPSLFFFPIIPFLATVGFTAYWVVVAAYLYSTGTITPHYRDSSTDPPSTLTLETLLGLQSGSVTAASLNLTAQAMLSSTAPPVLDDATCANSPDCYYSIDWNTQQKWLFIFHLFSLLWIFQFIVGFGQVSIAGTVAHFYWSGGDSRKMPRAPLLVSVSNALTYHLGSIAIGSFIIAVMQFVRLVFEWLAARFRKLQDKSGLGYLVCIIRGLLWLLEAILKFINRNAFIMVAVKGKSYCNSAARATVLLVANALRVAAVNTIGDFLLLLGKLGVAAGCGVAAMLLSDLRMFCDPVTYPDTYLSSPILPCAASVLAGYTVAHLFFSVFEMAMDTVLLCFCEDCEAHGGQPRFAPELLLEALGAAREAGSKGKVADDNRSAFIISKAGGAQAKKQAGGDDWEIVHGRA